METERQTFFCKACLRDRPAEEQSQDKRYCNFCFDFLAQEAKLLPPGRGPPKVGAAGLYRPARTGHRHAWGRT